MSNEPPHSRFMFYCLAPIMLAFVALMPILIPKHDLKTWLVLGPIEILVVLGLLVFYNAKKFWWCGRVASGIIFAAYVAYLVSMIVEGIWFDGWRLSASSAPNAILGMIFIGLPSLWFTIFGRFTLRPVRVYDLSEWEVTSDTETNSEDEDG